MPWMLSVLEEGEEYLLLSTLEEGEEYLLQQVHHREGKVEEEGKQLHIKQGKQAVLIHPKLLQEEEGGKGITTQALDHYTTWHLVMILLTQQHYLILMKQLLRLTQHRLPLKLIVRLVSPFYFAIC
jgi:hypothetical protein